ncbi:T9SS type A sorting domain-containing protein [Fulvivirgaceae bacterium PWU5]|uniref:T9SS type A sorting domain-containing protein n=1 Tax=Dawidia cretensis TaxID=2782350 RepID=A0AAP2GSQ9_9BACT|nr:PKD-like domain-containing protein [Dawidia cretensis]MBT1712061.1 T9SS type A sorting domain-containing protein [Dawidia cretensis]
MPIRPLLAALIFGWIGLLMPVLDASAQCTFTNLNPSYCVDAPAFTLTGGTYYYGPGVTGSTFDPAAAGVGTHTLIATNGDANTYTISTAGTYNPLSAAATTVTLANDDQTAAIPIGFTFNFFGNDQTTVRIGSNGLIGFGPSSVATSNNDVLTTTTDPDNIIAAAWDDLDPTLGGTIDYFLTGTAPNRVFVVRYTNIRRVGVLTLVTTQIQLHETTNIVEIHSPSIDLSSSAASQGIESPQVGASTTSYVVSGRNNTIWSATNDYVAFVPSCLDIRTVTIYPEPLTTPTVSPATTTLCAGSTVAVTVQGSQSGVSYQLQDDATSAVLSGFVGGTGGDIVITSNAIAAGTTMKVYARNPTTTCDTYLTDKITVTTQAATTANAGPDADVCGAVATLAGNTPVIGSGTWTKVSGPGTVSFGNNTQANSTATVSAYGTYIFQWAVTNGACPATVDHVQIRYSDLPAVTNPPTDAVMCEGLDASFTVVATGADLTYQWQVDNGGGFANLGSATTSPSLTVSAVTSTMNGYRYRAVVKGSCAPDAISAPARLTVYERPEIVGQPVSLTTCQLNAAPVSFTVDAGVTTGVSYQWQVSTNGGLTYSPIVSDGGGIYSNYTTGILSLSNLPVSYNGNVYRAVISGLCTPSVTSNGALLTVQSSASITTAPTPATVCEDGTVQFNVTATGTNLTYAWSVNGNPISDNSIYNGSSTATLTLSNVPASYHNNQYSVVVSSACANAGSTPVALTVNTKPVITSHPTATPPVICQGTNTTITVAASGTGVSYTWQVSTNSGVSYSPVSNGGVYSGATTSSLVLTAVPVGYDGYLYRAVATGSCAPPAVSNSALLRVQATAAITTEPVAQAVCEGGVIQFSAAAAGTGLTYRWQQNGTNLSNSAVFSGVTTPTLTITAPTSAFNGRTYNLVVTGACNTATSITVPLTIRENAEVASGGHPVTQTICAGSDATFTVNPGVTTTPVIQWQVSTNSGSTYSNITDGGVYSGATTNTLQITGATTTLNARVYRARVSGTCGSPVFSNGAILRVNASTGITTEPAASVVVCEDSNAQFRVVATGAGLTYQWKEDGVNLVNNASYNNVTTATLTVLAAQSVQNNRVYTVEVTGTCGTVLSTGGTLTIREKPEVTGHPGNQIICAGGGATFTVNAGVTTNAVYLWQVSTNGGSSYSTVTNGGVYAGATTATLTLTGTPASYNGYLYRARITGTCSPSIFSNSGLLQVNTLPAITAQPQPTTVCEGSAAQFSVAATGTGLSYQWHENGTPISNGGVYSGANSAVLMLNGVTSSFHGRQYSVTITGTCGTLPSNNATLSINEGPEVAVSGNPVAQIICQGGGTTFTVDPGITTNPLYQWQVSTNGGTSYAALTNGGVYAGVAMQTLTLTNVALSYQGYLYRVRISGTCTPPAFSDAALLTVQANPVITQQPVTATICEDGSTQFTVTATGAGLTYQWKQGSTDVSDGGVFSGATTPTLTLTNVPAGMDNSQFSVVVTGTCSTATSSVVPLHINRKPVVTASPVNNTPVCEGGNTSFSVTATGTGLTYAWQVSTDGGLQYNPVVNGGVYTNATTSTLTVTGTPLSHQGYLYRAVVSGTCAPPAVSNSAQLQLNAHVVVTQQPVPATTCEDGTIQFSVAATGTGLTYKWKQGSTYLTDGGVYSGTTTPILTLTNVPFGFNGNQYSVEIGGTCVGTTSTAVALTVQHKPVIVGQPSNSAPVCEGGNASFTVVATGTTAPTYGWEVSTNGGVSYTAVTNGGVYSDATTSALKLTGAPYAYNGYLYRAIVRGACEPPAISNSAVLTIQNQVSITSHPVNADVCEDGSTQFTVAAIGAGLTYKWKQGSAYLSDGGVFSGATTPILTLSNIPLTLNGEQFSVEITGTCSTLTSNAATLTLRTKPTAFAADASICTGQTTNIAITNPNSVSGTTFTWTVQSAVNITGALAGGGTTIAQQLFVTDGVSTGNVTYLVQPSAAGCTGPGFAVHVTVTPQPIAAASPQSICSGTATSVTITNTNGVTGTGYTWVVQASSNVSGQSAGDGSVISQVLTAVDGVNPGTVTYRITPHVNGCTGNVVDVTVTVNPQPGITNPPSTLVQEICSGTALSFLPTASITPGTTFTWESTVVGSLSGVTPTGTGAITDSPINTANTTGVVIYKITPSAGSCSGTPVNYVVSVRPKPTAYADGQTICSGESTTVTISNPNSVAGTTYTWTVLAAGTNNVSGATTGAGNVIRQALTSTDGLNTGTVTYQIIPYSGDCPGVPFDVTVTVKPVPVINNPPTDLTQQLCSAELLSFTPTSAISGVTFAWTSTFTGPIDPASVPVSGSGALSHMPVNTGNAVGIITYVFTPSVGGCTGPTVNLVVHVKPLPSAQADDVTICSGERAQIAILPAPQNVSGTTFTWTAVADANITGAASGDGSVIDQLLTTTNASVGHVVYTIYPSSNGCTGPLSTVTVTVNPAVTVTAGADFSVCEADVMPMNVPLTGTIGGGASDGTWFIKTGDGSISASTTTTLKEVLATYTAVNADVARGFVKLYLITNDPDLTGPCTTKTDTLMIFFNRRARIVPLVDYVVCEPNRIDLSGTLAGNAVNGAWSIVSAAGSLSVSSVTTDMRVNAPYTTALPADINQTLIFRLTANDPDGSGPCTAVFDEVNVLVQESAKVFAGADFAICENDVVHLNGNMSGAATQTTWSGGDGDPVRYSDVNDLHSLYTPTTADSIAGHIIFTLTSNDPDAGGPCTAVSDQVALTINRLPKPSIFGLEPAYAENDPIEVLQGFPQGPGGAFTGPGIQAGTSWFDPAHANIGINIITYTFTDANSCVGSVSQTVIVNPLTDINFGVQTGTGLADFSAEPRICTNVGKARLVGDPPVGTGLEPTSFASPLTPSILGSDAGGQYINTDGLLAGEYFVEYTYTNGLGATNTMLKRIVINASPQAVIGANNSCVTDSVAFTDLSTIPNNTFDGTINGWEWDFDDGNVKKTIQDPKWKYSREGYYNVTLTVKTDQNCTAVTEKQIFIGTKPKVDFTWTKICSGEATKFQSKSTISLGSIQEYSWNFDDGDVLPFGEVADNVPASTHDGRTQGTYENPSHQYQAFHTYRVNLRVRTDVGCEKDTTIAVYILDYHLPVSNNGYQTDFEDGQGAWIKVENGNPSSWEFGVPKGDIIRGAFSGDSAWWTGGNPNPGAAPYYSTYYGNEDSYVLGPCVNLSALERPMASIRYWSDTQKNFDGAVLQYSSDGGQNWRVVGADSERGIDWYNGSNLSGKPGGQDNFAWTDMTNGWRNGRFNLNDLPKDTVVFRIAFGANEDNDAGRILNGFAFDDIYIGEKERNVLVEHFTNNFSQPSLAADDYIDQLNPADHIKLQYHITTPGFDQIALDNTEDPAVRSQLYGVSQPPLAVMDGIFGNYYGVSFTGAYQKITNDELDRRSLEAPSFRIEIEIDPTAPSNVLRATVKYTFIDQEQTFTPPMILHAALVEDDIEIGTSGRYNHNSLRKLLFGPEGFLINEPLEIGKVYTRTVEYPIQVPITDGSNLSLLAFAQDKASRRILQTEIRKIDETKTPMIPVGLPDDPATAALARLKIYPNPASKHINLFLGTRLERDYSWKVVDQRGVTVLDGEVNRNLAAPQALDISSLPNGIYVLSIQASGKAVLYTKIVVLN